MRQMLFTLTLMLFSYKAYSFDKAAFIKNCGQDMHAAACPPGTPGDGTVYRCLKAYDKTSEKCKMHLGSIEKEYIDTLTKACSEARGTFCRDAKVGEGLACLKKHKDDPKMLKDYPNCRKVL